MPSSVSRYGRMNRLVDSDGCAALPRILKLGVASDTEGASLGRESPSLSSSSGMSKRPDRLRAARVLVAIVVAVLLGGSAAAFALTEQLKLERSPVYRTHVGKLLGPNCNCRLRRIPIQFVLRKPGRISLVVVDSGGHVVRTLLGSGVRPRGLQTFSWNGRDDAGQVVPAGTYKPRLHLSREHRTILMPNPITVDPTPPRITAASIAPRVVLAGRRRAARHRPHPLQGDRAVPRARVRERPAARKDQALRRDRCRALARDRAAPGPVQADAPNDGPRRERLCARRSRRRPDPLHLGGAARPACAREGADRLPRRDRREDVPVAAGTRRRRLAARAADPASARAAGPVPARGDRERPHCRVGAVRGGAARELRACADRGAGRRCRARRVAARSRRAPTGLPGSWPGPPASARSPSTSSPADTPRSSERPRSRGSSWPGSAPRSSSAGRGCSRSRSSRAFPPGSPSRSARPTRTCSSRSTASSRPPPSRSRGSS